MLFTKKWDMFNITTFYKSDFHREETARLLKRLGQSTDITKDVYYGTFAYIVGATYKVSQIWDTVDEDGIDLERLLETIDPYSVSEKIMIRFALQCFNSRLDDISISDVMRHLDDENTKVIKQAIDIRY